MEKIMVEAMETSNVKTLVSHKNQRLTRAASFSNNGKSSTSIPTRCCPICIIDTTSTISKRTLITSALFVALLATTTCCVDAFTVRPPSSSRAAVSPSSSWHAHAQGHRRRNQMIRIGRRPLYSTPMVIVLDGDGDDDDDDDDIDILRLDEDDLLEEDDEEEEEEPDPYTQRASSEFEDFVKRESALMKMDDAPNGNSPTTNMDWGGALGKLRERVDDVESGKSQDPSQALFRVMSAETPNQLIGKFVSTAKPQIVQAMSGAVTSLLGGLSQPSSGVETLVKASGERIGSLCFQLQMTGYMFRNAEYVLALKDLLKLRGADNTIEDYREAFDRLDTDNSGYIESSEIKDLLDNVYDGDAPDYEIQAFLQFFDQNNDGKISWEEFEQGFAAAMDAQKSKDDFAVKYLQAQELDDDMDDEDEHIDVQADVKGTIQVELENGKVVEVEASEYIDALKQEAKELKEALRREKYGSAPGGANAGGAGVLPGPGMQGQGGGPAQDDLGGDIVGYIASRQGDMKSLTEGVSPEVVETMKKLVDFVLEGGQQRSSSGGTGGSPQGPMSNEERAKMEMEIPGSALQQLALWQLVLGYRLREAEAKREYLKLLE